MLDVSSSTYVARNSSSKNYSFLGKDHIEIRKFDGSNFALWKNQMRDVLVQRKQTRPLGGKAKKPDDMDDDDWEELDALMPYVTCPSGGRYRPCMVQPSIVCTLSLGLLVGDCYMYIETCT